MKIDYAQWLQPRGSAGEYDLVVTVDALFYDILRLTVARPGPPDAAAPRFADVAVTGRDGVKRFVAGYAMISGSTTGPVELAVSGPGPVAGTLAQDGTNPARFLLRFPSAKVIGTDGDLTVTDAGFGVMGAPGTISESSEGVAIALGLDSSTLVIGGPTDDRIRNRARLARAGVDLLPSY